MTDIPSTPEGLGDLGREFVVTRIDPIANSVVTSNGRGRLIQPDARLVQQLMSADPKIHYFPVPDVEAVQATDERIDLVFSQLIMDPLVGELVRQFPDRLLALRAIKTSINGTIKVDDELTVHDLTSVVKLGNDQGKQIFNVAVLDPIDTVTIHRVTQYAADTELFRFEMPSPELADSVFPAILVYDCDQLVHGGRGVWSAGFRNPEQFQDALLGAYIVDCPALR